MFTVVKSAKYIILYYYYNIILIIIPVFWCAFISFDWTAQHVHKSISDLSVLVYNLLISNKISKALAKFTLETSNPSWTGFLSEIKDKAVKQNSLGNMCL